ncbi:MAG: O-antigen ligase family protein [Pyrinomonadaceae bacterium]
MISANRIAFFLICATLVFTTVAYGGVHQPVLAIFYLLVAAIAISFAVQGLRTGVLPVDQSLLQLPIFGAAIYGFIQIIPFGHFAGAAGVEGIARTISVDPFSTQINAFHFLALSILFSSVLMAIDSASRIRKFTTLIVVFGFVFAFYAILQSFLSPNLIYGIYGSPYASPFGSFVNRNNSAAFLEMSICVPLGLLFAGSISRDKRLVLITAISLMGIALILSGSRGGFVAMLAGLIVLVILTRTSHGRKQFILRVSLAAALVLTIVGGAILVGGENSLSRFAETAQSNDATSSRVYIWKVTLKVIAANMPFGAGLGAFGTAFTPFDTNGGLLRIEQAHNDYLQIASDAGVVGIVLGGGFLFLLIRTGIRSSATRNSYRRGVAVGAFAGCCSILIHSLFDFVLHTTALSILFLMLTALIVASGRKYQDDVEDEKSDRRKRSKATVRRIHDRHGLDGILSPRPPEPLPPHEA